MNEYTHIALLLEFFFFPAYARQLDQLLAARIDALTALRGKLFKDSIISRWLLGTFLHKNRSQKILKNQV